MKNKLILSAGALLLAAIPAHATGQTMHMHMPGMTMPMPAKPAAKKPATKKKPAAKKPAVKSVSRNQKAPAKKTATTATAKKPASTHQTHSSAPMKGMTMPISHDAAPITGKAEQPMATPIDHGAMSMDHGTIQMPSQAAPAAPMDHSQMSMPMDEHGGHDMNMPVGKDNMWMGQHGGHDMAMTGAFGPYPMEREASGTAWQPDTSEHMGLTKMSGDWTLMGHGVINLSYDHQGGPRGDNKVFASGMLMGMARRPLGNGTLQLKAMLSPDPIMGPSGYPLLLASGETANGTDRLIDRQHPHDLFMELSGSLSQNIGKKSSVFLYAGLPGEPAFGPPAFMHREAIMDSPEAPITHHWLDSTHISFGVVTAGLVLDRAKIEISRFNGREPDEHRWNIETGPLDSTAVRVSWNPTRTLALQGSWGHFVDPEELEPGVDQKRLSASLLYADEIAPGLKLAATLAWGRKTAEGHSDEGYAAEASVKHQGWTVFSRGELTQNRELLGVEHGSAYRVGKVSLGAVRDFRVAEHLSFGVGGLFSVNFVPDALAPLYGGHSPTGAMGFVRLRLN